MPENAAPGTERPTFLLASWGQRARAYLLDVAIVLVPLLAVWALILPWLFGRAGDDERLRADLDLLMDASTDEAPIGRLAQWILLFVLVVSLLYWLVMGLYSAVFMAQTGGRTPGGRLVGIRVMRADGKPASFGWALYRTLVLRELLFGLATLFSLGLANVAQYLWPLWDPERRTLHDIAARSRVVVDDRQQ